MGYGSNYPPQPAPAVTPVAELTPLLTDGVPDDDDTTVLDTASTTAELSLT